MHSTYLLLLHTPNPGRRGDIPDASIYGSVGRRGDEGLAGLGSRPMRRVPRASLLSGGNGRRWPIDR